MADESAPTPEQIALERMKLYDVKQLVMFLTWDVANLSRAVETMDMRQREIAERMEDLLQTLLRK